MQVKCPACGAEMSLDALIDNDAATAALNLALSMTPLGKLLVRYLGLFRPAKTKLTWSRVATLLGELLPSIEAQRIERNGTVYEAPQEVWCAAIESMLASRTNIQLPLKSHGYLFEVIVSEGARSQARGLVTRDGVVGTTSRSMSGTAQAVTALEQRKNKGQS